MVTTVLTHPIRALTALALAAAVWQAVPSDDADRVSLHTDNFDLEVLPGVDFDAFVNGGWNARHPVPAGYGSWDGFQELDERNRDTLHRILEQAAADTEALPGSDVARIGAFYAGCMDLDGIELAGLSPLRALLDAIDRVEDTDGLIVVLASLHRFGIMPTFSVFPARSPDDPTRIVLWIWQGGMGLPGRGLYLDGTDEASALREQYVAHIARMFGLMGAEDEAARLAAAAVLDLESRLAQAAVTSASESVEQIMSRSELDALTPAIAWESYFGALGLSDADVVNVGQPAFLERVDRLLGSVAIADWKDYLRWRLISELAPALAADFDNESFAFNQRTLRGSSEPLARWIRCLSATDAALGESLGRVFVARTFSPEAKEKALGMAQAVRDAALARVDTWDWMSDEARAAARDKLQSVRFKVGYPYAWPDHVGMRAPIGEAEPARAHASNVLLTLVAQMNRMLATVGQPYDPGAWTEMPQTASAWYDPVANELVFGVGILQPPFFGLAQDDAANFGSIGALMGHELSHALFGAGADVDASGQRRRWWTEEDQAAFTARVEPLIEQYDAFVVLGDLPVAGRQTLGENLGDLAGLTFAWHAWRAVSEPGPGEPIDGFSPSQRFFMAWAQTWREQVRDNVLASQVVDGLQAPSHFRIHGPLSQMPEFAEAFELEPGAPLQLAEDARARVW
jgi:predicted metalloendopeptidase